MAVSFIFAVSFVDLAIDVPDFLDLSRLRATGLQAGEEELPDLMPPIVLPEDTRGRETILHWTQCLPCSPPDKPVHLKWTRLQRGMCKGHVLPNLICSIFLTLNGRWTLRQPRWLTHRGSRVFLIDANANDTVGPWNQWEQFRTFVFNFTTLTFILKVIIFSGILVVFTRWSCLWALKGCRRLETGVNSCNPLEETGSITLCEVLALLSQWWEGL